MQSRFLRYSKQFARLAAVWLIFLAGTAQADDSKISPDLLRLLSNPSANINVIVQYNSAPPQQSCTSGGILGELVCPAAHIVGGLVKTVFTIIKAATAVLTPGGIINLSNQPNVSYISLDRSLNATLDYTAAAVDSPYAWTSGLTGAGVGIAIIDSGIYSHPDLGSRVIYRHNLIGGGVQYDDFGHGTHVAGIAAGSGAASSMPGTSASWGTNGSGEN